MSLYLFRIHYLLYCFLLKIILKIWMEFKLFKKLLLLLFSNCHESTHSVGVFCSIFLHWVIKLTQKHIIAFS